MAIYQTNTFICEVCGKAESVTEKVSLHEDPVVTLLGATEWGFDEDDRLNCAACLVQCKCGVDQSGRSGPS